MSESRVWERAVEREGRRQRYDPRQRFRPYRITPDGGRDWIAAAGCETPLGIVPMLIQLHADGEFTTAEHVGVLDTGPWRGGNPASWTINPFPERRSFH